MPSALPIEPVKRLRYFDGQFLQVSDFNDEQTYHRRMLELHNGALLTPGVVEGLVPAIKNGRLEISPGVAVDAQGREIVLAAPLVRDLAGSGVLYLQFHDEPADLATAGTVSEETRFVQKPQLIVSDGTAPADGVRLGRLTGGSPQSVSLADVDRDVARIKMELTGRQTVIVELRADVDRHTREIDELARKLELASFPPGAVALWPGPESTIPRGWRLWQAPPPPPPPANPDASSKLHTSIEKVLELDGSAYVEIKNTTGSFGKPTNQLTLEALVKEKRGGALVSYVGTAEWQVEKTETYVEEVLLFFSKERTRKIQVTEKYKHALTFLSSAGTAFKLDEGAMIGDWKASAPDDWTHLALTINGNDKKCIAYRDGIKIGEATLPGQFSRQMSAQQLLIGARIAGTDEAQLFSGLLTEVRIWNQLRSEAQIKSAMHRRLSASEISEMFGYWPLNGDVLDKSGNNRHGVLMGGGWEELTPSKVEPQKFLPDPLKFIVKN